MNGRQHADWHDIYIDLKEALATAQLDRRLRDEMVGGEPAWVLHERQAMTDRVNALRARRGVGPVSMTAVEAKERLACGHSDYTTKWAIGCADLVTDEPVSTPEKRSPT